MTPSTTLLTLISAAVTPVVLVTAGAILLSAFAGKYSNISEQMRRLTAEFRDGETLERRRSVVRRQLVLYRMRIWLIWAASTTLCLAVLAFLMMVPIVLLSQTALRLNVLAVAVLVAGLVLMVVSVALELRELWLARITANIEVSQTLDHPSGERK